TSESPEARPAADDSRDARSEDRKLSADELKQAITNGQLRVCYQPKVYCKTGLLSGLEALAGWQHPQRRTSASEAFIPLAESNGLIDALTIEVMTQAMQWYRGFCAELQQLSSTRPGFPEPDTLTLSINISALSLSNTHIFDSLTQMCADYDIEPGNVIFEL